MNLAVWESPVLSTEWQELLTRRGLLPSGLSNSAPELFHLTGVIPGLVTVMPPSLRCDHWACSDLAHLHTAPAPE